MNALFDFPGDPFIAQTLKAILQIGFLVALYILCLRVLKHYIPGGSAGNRALGMILGGGLLGIVAAKFYATTYAHVFSADPSYVSIALILGILGNLAIANFMYSTPER